MVLIVGPYPDASNEQDGMVQRVKHIDSIITDIDRTYLCIKFFSNFKKEVKNYKNVTVYQLNAFIHFFLIFYLIVKANFIYVHSIYNSLHILPAYFLNKVIFTDMHGVVVEEIKINTKHNKFLIYWAVIVYSIVEWIACKRSDLIISVTESMGKYFSRTYNLENTKNVVVPIYNNLAINSNNNVDKTGIYSGGTQPWQCVNDTVELINTFKNSWRWTILTPDVDIFRKGLLEDENITVKSVQPSEVENYYLHHTFGMILRDESIINRVACPTKLIEYLKNGLIPIIKTPYIGDFYDLGYRYISLEDMNHIEDFDLVEMRNKNYAVIEVLKENHDKGLKILKGRMGDFL